LAVCLLVVLALGVVGADDHQLQGTRKKRPPAQPGSTASQQPPDQRPAGATPPPVNAKEQEQEEEEDPEMMRKVKEFRKRKKAALEAAASPKPPPPPSLAPQPADPAPPLQPPVGASDETHVPKGGDSGRDGSLAGPTGAGTQDSTDGEKAPGAGPDAGAGRAEGGDGGVPNVETDEDGEAKRRRVAEAEEARVIAEQLPEKLRERDEQVLALPQERRERIFIELMTSDRKLEASGEGSK